VALAVLLLLGVIAGQLVATDLIAGDEPFTDPCYLFQRNFWVDELHTFALVSDPDFGHSMEALANCVDGSPPTFHVLLRGFTALTGGPSETTHRGFAFTCVLLALAGLYTHLRQVFTRAVSFTAVLAVWNHPLVLHNAFEARYYAPWLAALAWFAFFFCRARVHPRPLNSLLLAACAVLVCTVHYFGIFTLVLVTAFELLVHRPGRLARWTGLAAVSLGVLALVASTPFYLGQSAGLSRPTWIEARDLKGTVQFILAALDPGYLSAVVLVALLGAVVGPVPRSKPRSGALDPRPLAGLTGVVFLPFVVIAFSIVVQPSLEDRYATTAALGLGAAVAWVLARVHWVWLAGLCLLLVTVGAYRLELERKGYREVDDYTTALITAIREHTGKGPVVFETIHQLFVVCHYAPDLADRCYKLDFEEEDIPADDGRLIDRDLARRFAECYSKPGLLKWDDLLRLPKKFFVPDADFPQMSESEREDLYPGWQLTDIDGGLFRLAPRVEETGPPEQKAGGK
jgi:hypothetical protein